MFARAATSSRAHPVRPPPSYMWYQGLERKWERVDDHPRGDRETVISLTVATYNMLSDQQIRLNSELYSHLPKYMLSWQYRSQLLVQEVLFFDADILCLQEVDEHHYYHFFAGKLNEYGYAGWYERRTGDKPDGCAIFWKYELFERALVKSVRYNVPGVQVLDRDNVGIVAIIKLRRSSRLDDFPVAVCVATTHLLFNSKRGDIKLAQLVLLFTEIGQAYKQFRHRNPFYHVFLLFCGDLNIYPFSPLYSFITTGSINYEGMDRTTLSGQKPIHEEQETSVASHYKLRYPLLPNWLNIDHNCCYRRHLSTHRQQAQRLTSEESSSGVPHLSHMFHFSSAYGHTTPTRQLEVTTFLLNGTRNTVDYIFYTSSPLDIEPSDRHHETHPTMKLTDRRTLISGDCLGMIGALPNSLMPSDHQALQARFNLSIPRRYDRTAIRSSRIVYS